MALLSSTLLLRTHSLTLLTIAFYLVFSPGQILNATPVWLLGESMSVRPALFAPQEIPNDPSPSSLPILPGSRQRNAPSSAGSLPFSAVGQNNSTGQREVLALLALVVAGWAFMQFVFAGELAVLAAPNTATTTTQKQSSSSSTPAAMSSPRQPQSSTSSRYGEELHTLYAAQSRWLTFAGLRMLGSAGLVAWIYVFHSHNRSSFAPLSSTTPLTGTALLANRVTFTAALSDMLFWGYFWTVVKEETRLVAQNVARMREAEDHE
ncbi:hypothetical protein LTR84_009278 [Exophiala bonariae]|uniref:Uncharacterized protein n=1 Tax=Exophiala bonariae TaxID=1690606 RepID=A0AAV9MVL0_9EURO|nr:hypothetical protein LTR84_009278 [Exophiala bonariae]